MFSSLNQAYAYATEVQMATLDDMEMKKSTAKSALNRQNRIVREMLDVCGAFSVGPIGTTPRLRDALLARCSSRMGWLT